MTFYHGTNKLIDAIDLSKSRNRVDFGKGFYFTDNADTAYSLAIRKVEIEGEGIPTVLCYGISPAIYDLSGLRFSELPEISWLDFICSNRKMVSTEAMEKEPRHDYNWLAGPIADDKDVDFIAEYMRNEISADNAIKRLRALPQAQQLSLHTKEAIDYINEDYVLYKQLKKGRWSQEWTRRK